MKMVKSLLLASAIALALTACNIAPAKSYAADVTVTPKPSPLIRCWYRSSITGRFVTKEEADAKPTTTVKECQRKERR